MRGDAASSMLRGVSLSAIRGDRRLFSGLSFDIEPGELLYVNGPNGSGKTTLLRMLCGLVLPADGEVRWGGRDIHALGDAYRAELLYCGHHSAVKDDLNCLENLEISSRLGGQRIETRQALDALGHLGLDGLEELPAKLLSQGQRRRLSLTRLVFSEARLWILDEPFTALDVAAIEVVRSLIRNHLAKSGLIVLTTHQRVDIDASRIKQVPMGVAA